MGAGYPTMQARRTNVAEVKVDYESAEQIIKADRLRMSHPLQDSKACAMLRRLNSTVTLHI